MAIEADALDQETILSLDETTNSTQGTTPQSEGGLTPGIDQTLGKDEELAKAVAGLPPIFDDKYKVLEQIGAGGMSTVYKVQHIHLNKVFALKVLQHLKEESLGRFRQEAKASSLLEHSNIVKVHDFGIANGLPYMTMDYIDGLALSDYCKSAGPLSLQRITRIFGQICLALAHAHENGVVHRDLKPSNIIVRKMENGLDQAIVIDFGIAKIIETTDAPASNGLTHTGDIFGTPYYMSPEQCQGRGVDSRSDIYSLGCVMYETITGRLPFKGTSIYGTIFKQMTEAPDSFPEALRKTTAGKRLEAMVLKSMAKLPENRQQHVLELSSELKSVELGDCGFWTDLKSLWRIVTGRINAAEHRSLALKSLLNFLGALAVIVALCSLFFPGLIESSNKEIQRNKNVSKLLQVDYSYELISDMADGNRQLIKTYNSIDQLCKEDEKENKISANLVDIARKFRDNFESIKLLNKKAKEDMNFSRLQLRMAQVEAAKQHWSLCFDALKKSINLSGISEEEVKEEEQHSQIYFMVLWACYLLTPVLLLILPFLTWCRFRDIGDAKAAMANEKKASHYH